MKKVIARHCDENPKTFNLKDGEKKAFICEGCHGVFEINSEGEITKSPLKNGTVQTKYSLYDISCGKAVSTGDVYK